MTLNLYTHRSDESLEEINTVSINNIQFTSRETDVLACLLSGKSSKMIAVFLSITPKTVAAHLQKIMARLGCNSREHIIELSERSSCFPLLKKHYIDLLIEKDFINKLENFSSSIQQSAPTCLLVDRLVYYNPNILEKFSIA